MISTWPLARNAGGEQGVFSHVYWMQDTAIHQSGYDSVQCDRSSPLNIIGRMAFSETTRPLGLRTVHLLQSGALWVLVESLHGIAMLRHVSWKHFESIGGLFGCNL